MPAPAAALSHLLIEKIVRQALEEDLGPSLQDISSAVTVPANQDIKASIVTRKDGVLSGIIAALSAFTLLDPELEIEVFAYDGDAIDAGETLATIHGSARSILAAERTALNILGHLSGIATTTHSFVEEIKGTGATIVETRKTLPGLRALQKYAVQCGGGSNHRCGLYDAIMIKDNHIAAAGDIATALTNANLIAGHTTKIEIEVDTIDQLKQVLAHGGADIVMLDNMDTNALSEAIKLIDGHLITEASGNVNMKTVRAIAETGVDIISIGALTHSVINLDIGLDIDN